MQREWFANIAISKDGFLGRNDKQVNISSIMDWKIVHRLRNRSAAIGIGSNTLIIDNPSLLVKPKYLKTPNINHPVAIIFDRRGRLIPECNLMSTAVSRPVFWCTQSEKSIENTIKIDYQDLIQVCGQIEIELDTLGIEGPIMIEGGATLISSLIQSALLHKIRIFTSNTSLLNGVRFDRDKYLRLFSRKNWRKITGGIEEIFVLEDF